MSDRVEDSEGIRSRHIRNASEPGASNPRSDHGGRRSVAVPDKDVGGLNARTSKCIEDGLGRLPPPWANDPSVNGMLQGGRTSSCSNKDKWLTRARPITNAKGLETLHEAMEAAIEHGEGESAVAQQARVGGSAGSRGFVSTSGLVRQNVEMLVAAVGRLTATHNRLAWAVVEERLRKALFARQYHRTIEAIATERLGHYGEKQLAGPAGHVRTKAKALLRQALATNHPGIESQLNKYIVGAQRW